MSSSSTFQQKLQNEGPRKSIIILLIVYHIIAFAVAPLTFTISGLIVAISLYYLTGLGVTVGYHRMLTHGGFAVHRITKCVLAILGALSGQGHCYYWCAAHRMHHQHSDKDGDPHSPVHGVWWSHTTWLLTPISPEEWTAYFRRYIKKDLLKDKDLQWICHTYKWQHLLLILLLAIAGYFYGGVQYATSWVVWGYFVRMVFLLHSTWAVNSASHMWGYRNYETRDQSRNNWVVALLSFGEGWHNNHHGVAPACNHARRWWEYLYDPSYWLIWTMSKTGLAWDLKVAESPVRPTE